MDDIVMETIMFAKRNQSKLTNNQFKMIVMAAIDNLDGRELDKLLEIIEFVQKMSSKK